MRVLVCPTAFKGTLGAAEAADAMARGVRRALPSARMRRLPLSDGGPGLLDALRAAGLGGAPEEVEVGGPLGRPARARILWVEDGGPGDAADDDGAPPPGRRGGQPDVAVVESADACGLHLVPEGGEDALRADTGGVGELIGIALERGARGVVVGLGGSATTDGGTGMARAFGYRFLDGSGKGLPPGGGSLTRLARIVPGRRPSRPIIALADVETPLNGARGAARTFGPQKGATGEELEELVAGLERLAGRLEADLGRGEVADLPGSGAAGGLGAGLAAFLGALIAPGAEWVLEAAGFEEALAEADLVVTGEGAFDATSREGKIAGRVLGRAREAGVPVLLLCGRVQAAAVPGTGGRPPPVRVADGGGEVLDAAGLEALAAREAGALGG